MTGPLRERDDAHALLAAEIERARAGTGRLVLLRGASGTGRTAVLETAARHAADRGLRVLRVRCSPEDTAVPFSAVLHLLGPVPEFTDVAPGDDDRGSAARLWRLLRSYAAEGPLLVAVDDVHLADEPSRRWLAEAGRHVDRLPLLLVATERSQYDIEPRPAGLTQALSPSLVRTHTLAPLSDAAAAGLVRAAFPGASARWTADCVRAGAGSPLLLHALLDDLGGTRHPEGLPRVPETSAELYPGSYPAAVSWWLKSAGPATADVARSLAALEQAWPQGRPQRRAGLRHALDQPAPPAPAGHAEPEHDRPAEYGDGGPYPQPVRYARTETRRAACADPGPSQAFDPLITDPAPLATAPGPHIDAWSGGFEPGSGGVGGAGRGPYGETAVPARGGAGVGHQAYGPYGRPGRDVPGSEGGPSYALHDEYEAFPGDTPASCYGPDAPSAHVRHRTPGRWRTPTSPEGPAGAAGAGDPVDVLAEAAGADPARVAGWLAAMTRLGLLRNDAGGRPRFAHPLLRDAVLTGWPRPRREAVH
ncbi:ATP-binding protein, partial [Streptomyces sp. NPDC057074]|uniref:ATP-binding protein n=1 Tax=Streptomyces sp. NPDC057074 TaxID=3346015 RepID=UPI003627BD16